MSGVRTPNEIIQLVCDDFNLERNMADKIENRLVKGLLSASDDNATLVITVKKTSLNGHMLNRNNQQNKRTWCYVMPPQAYEITCDLCGGSNITWSEFEHMIWCFDCKQDTPGIGGFLDGPVPLKLAQMLGISFDRVDLETGEILYMRETNEKLVWEKIETEPQK